MTDSLEQRRQRVAASALFDLLADQHNIGVPVVSLIERANAFADAWIALEERNARQASATAERKAS